eukprot:110761_1
MKFPTFDDKIALKDKPGKAGDPLFHDPDGNPSLPDSLSELVSEWCRPSDLSMYESKTVVVVTKGSFDQRSIESLKDMKIPSNRFAASLAAQFSIVADLAMSLSEGSFLWELIYPQDKGTAVANPVGKYWVKLFLQNEWRLVDVDDKIPVDSSGFPLWPYIFPSDENEEVSIWPLILAKALFKVNGAGME